MNTAIEMVSIPSGTLYFGPKARPFEMEAFSVMKYPVTCSQWLKVARNLDPVNKKLDLNPSEISEPQGSLLPVLNVKYEDIQEFAARLSKEGGTNFRLPTETEWEYLLKGSAIEYPSNEGNTYKSGDENRALSPVNAFHPNAFNVSDLIGNAWEYTSTVYQDQYTIEVYNGQGLVVLRGGSYVTRRDDCCFSRQRQHPCHYNSSATFRLVVSES